MIGEIVAIKREDKIFNHLVVCEVKDGKIDKSSKYGIRFTDLELRRIMRKLNIKYKKDFVGERVLMTKGRGYILGNSQKTKHGGSHEIHRIY